MSFSNCSFMGITYEGTPERLCHALAYTDINESHNYALGWRSSTNSGVWGGVALSSQAEISYIL